MDRAIWDLFNVKQDVDMCLYRILGLVDAGVSINFTRKVGDETAFMGAVARGSLSWMKILKEKGANILGAHRFAKKGEAMSLLAEWFQEELLKPQKKLTPQKRHLDTSFDEVQEEARNLLQRIEEYLNTPLLTEKETL